MINQSPKRSPKRCYFQPLTKRSDIHLRTEARSLSRARVWWRHFCWSVRPIYKFKKHSVIELVHLSPFFVLFTTIMRQLHIVQTVYISSTPINDRLCPIKVLLCSLSATFLYPINHDQLYFLEPHL